MRASASAQTFEEWFRQEQTQEKYLVQQIAALQAYSGTLRQGYETARLGISTVQQIKNGDLGLHQVFFRSLRQVNPLLRDTRLATDILSLLAATLRGLEATARFTAGTGQLTAAEQAYGQQVKARVLEACSRDTETLWLLLTDDALEMPDNSRLLQLEALYGSARDHYRFTQSFLEQVQLLAVQREKEQQYLARLRTLFDNP